MFKTEPKTLLEVQEQRHSSSYVSSFFRYSHFPLFTVDHKQLDISSPSRTLLCSTAGVAFLVWTIVRAGGLGSVVSTKTTLTGSVHGWAFVSSMVLPISQL